MKGTPEAPACGFSARTVAALQSLDAPFAAVDVLPDPRIRQELSAISNWPTIPQLFVDGELRRRLRHRHRDVRVGGARAGVAVASRAAWPPSRSQPTAPTTCRARSRDDEGVHQVSLYVGWKGEPERELEMDGFDGFYERLRAIANCRPPHSRRSATSSPSGSRCSRTATTSSRSTSRAASPAPSRPRARRTGCSPSAASASASR